MVDQKLKSADKLASYMHTAQVTITTHTSLSQAIILGLVLQSLKPNCYVFIILSFFYDQIQNWGMIGPGLIRTE